MPLAMYQVMNSFGGFAMSGKSNNIYWDACIFLAHLKGEVRADPMDMPGIHELVKRIDNKELQLITSVLTLAEVLESSLNADARNRFRLLFQRRNVLLIDVTARIAEISHNIRDYYQQRKATDNLPTVGTPDAIHIATAIEYQCDRFYTFDEKDEPRRRRAIIPLSPVIANQYNLIIEKPAPTQIPLDFPPEPREAGL